MIMKKPNEWVTLEIDSFNQIKDLLTKTQQLSSMHVLIGGSGLGKSSTFEWYKRVHPNVFLVKIEHTYSAKDFYLEILQKIGIRDHDRKANLKSMSDRIANALQTRKEKCLLILDECSKASVDFLRNFQCIRDLNTENLGIILSGTSKFKDDFDKWTRQNHTAIPELASRIYSWEYLKSATPEEKFEIVSANGVKGERQINSIVGKSPDLRRLYQNVIQYKYDQVK